MTTKHSTSRRLPFESVKTLYSAFFPEGRWVFLHILLPAGIFAAFWYLLLGSCSTEEIVNAYDNAVLYTDHLLAQLIGQLRANHTHDVAMIYLSDHGESLGEHGLYLHGVPYAIAPAQQTRVPMLVWLSSGLQASTGIAQACLAGQSTRALSHDHLFHSVLGLLGVETSVYDASLDLFATCHQSAARIAPDANAAPLKRQEAAGP